MVHPHREAPRGRAQQPAQAPAQRDPPAARLAHRRARAARGRRGADMSGAVGAASDVPLNEMSGERCERVPGTPPVRRRPRGCALGQLTLADDLQALAARDADAGDEEQGSAAEGDQDAVVDAVVRRGVRRRGGLDRLRVDRPRGQPRTTGRPGARRDLVGRAQVLRGCRRRWPTRRRLRRRVAACAGDGVGAIAAAAMPATISRLNLDWNIAPPGR